MGLCSSAPPPDPSEVHAQLEAWCATVRLQFNAIMPVLILYNKGGDIYIDGDIPQDIRDQFGFVKHTIPTRSNGNRRQMPLWTIAANRKKSDEPLITAAYVLSALVDKHAFKIVGQCGGGDFYNAATTTDTNCYAMVKDK